MERKREAEESGEDLMPSVSGKQHRFMEMVAHNPRAAKRVGVPQSVGKDFVAADKGKQFEGSEARNNHKLHNAKKK